MVMASDATITMATVPFLKNFWAYIGCHPSRLTIIRS